MSHAKTPPTLPTVVDEAGDTPGWVPALGLTLFAVLALVAAVRYAIDDAQPSAAPVQAAQAAQPAEPE